MKYGPKHCINPLCGIEFIPKTYNQVYCDGWCRDRWDHRVLRMTHPDKVRQAKAVYYIKHGEEVRAKRKQYVKLNRENVRQSLREWREEQGRDRLNARHREWSALNHQRIAAWASRRRANKKVPSYLHDITPQEWQGLLEAYEYKCAYCKQPSNDLTQDHIIPLIKGGLHTMENIAPACRPCNSRKGTRDLIDFLVDDLEV